MRVLAADLRLRNALGGMPEDIGHFQQVLAEALNAKLFRIVNLFRQPLAKVLAISQGPLVLVQELCIFVLVLGHFLGQVLDLNGELLFVFCQLRLGLLLGLLQTTSTGQGQGSRGTGGRGMYIG